MDEEVVYRGCRIHPRTWLLDDGGFAAKAVVQPVVEAGGPSHLVLLPERWPTEDEARRNAIDAGKHLIDDRLGTEPGRSSAD